MKPTTIGVILLCLMCWAFPIKTLADTAPKPKPNIQTKIIVAYHDDSYRSDDIIIRDNAIQKPLVAEIGTGILLKPTPEIQPDTKQFGNTNSFDRRSYSKEEVQQLIRDYSLRYGISADLPLRVAGCESGFNQFSKNRTSTASGVYQWLASSWRNQPVSKNGSVSVFDADANVSAAVWLIAHGQTSPWNASRSCWSK